MTLMSTDKPRLGSNQTGVLDSIRRRGSYAEGCGWVWGTHSRTVRILKSLERHGLVRRVQHLEFDEWFPVNSTPDEK